MSPASDDITNAKQSILDKLLFQGRPLVLPDLDPIQASESQDSVSTLELDASPSQSRYSEACAATERPPISPPNQQVVKPCYA